MITNYGFIMYTQVRSMITNYGFIIHTQVRTTKLLAMLSVAGYMCT